MPKDRSQMTPDNPHDWAKIQSGRGQGTGGTGYDRLPGEQARPELRDNDPAAETIPEPLGTLTPELTTSDEEIAAQEDAAWEAHDRTTQNAEPADTIERLKRTAAGAMSTATSMATSVATRAGGAARHAVSKLAARTRHAVSELNK